MDIVPSWNIKACKLAQMHDKYWYDFIALRVIKSNIMYIWHEVGFVIIQWLATVAQLDVRKYVFMYAGFLSSRLEKYPGPSCSKLTMLKLWSLNIAYTNLQKLLTFFSAKMPVN